MRYGDPEPDDPQVLVGVSLPGDEKTTLEMAEAFADEFAQLGTGSEEILAMFRSPFYAGAHRAYTVLGELTLRRLIDESVEVWGRFRRVVRDAAPEGAAGTSPSGVNAYLKKLGS
jgi:hypothetical protein